VQRISRFDPSEIPVQIAGEVRDFDELAWVDKRDRKHVSRVLPLALAAASEALATAGVEPDAMPLESKRRMGVILGSGGGSQEFTEEQYRLFFQQKYKQMSLFCVPTGVMGTLSSELSVRFGLRGPSHVITTGCTSSTDAMGYAMRQIQSRRMDMALVGGADAPIALGIVKGFILMKIMTDSWNHAPERASRPFSVDRDGFVLAEGSWMFVVEEYEHARARGASMLAEICGYGSTCEAYHRVRLQECGEEPARAIGLAMQQAGIGSANVDYVNLHGTSTQLNDRIETRALKLALGERAREVPMSALKSQIGHPQGACGAAGVAATLVAMQRGQIPPTINLENADPECDLDYVPHAGRKKNIEHAICNCIAFGSKNSALVLRRVA
jgi:3-oxoacyl-[acyl-carrier-protein] synthase II